MPHADLLILTICSGVILYATTNLYRSGFCVECGGRGKHKPGCRTGKL